MNQQDTQWKTINVDTDGCEIENLDPSSLIIPASSSDEDKIPEGYSVAAVKTEELWLVDINTGEIETKLASTTSIKHLGLDESAATIARIEAEGLTLQALKEYFI